MPDKKLTDKEIVKALEELLKELKGKKQLIVSEEGVKNLCYCLQNYLNLINRLQAENENLKDILYDAEGVNLVNYWYQQCKIAENGCKNFEEENKKLQAENKNLQERNVILRGLVDTQKAENERLQKEMEGWRDTAYHEANQCETAKAENERLREENKDKRLMILQLQQSIDYLKSQYFEYKEKLATAKSEAYKEFADKVKAKFCRGYYYLEIGEKAFSNGIDNLLKELVGEQPILNDVKCKDCEYLELELPYAVCSKAYKGIVQPNDSCGKGKLKKVGEDK